MTPPTLDELYKQSEFIIYNPDIPRMNVTQYREGYSRWGAVAMSLQEWDHRAELQIGDGILYMLGFSGITQGSEIVIEDTRLLAFKYETPARAWVFLDATQKENHERLMWHLALETELACKFTLICIMQAQAEILFPDMISGRVML